MRAHFVDHHLHVLVTDTERVFGEHPAGVCNRHVGESLTDHGDLHATALEELVGRKQLGRFIPFGVENVLTQCSKGQTFDDFLHTGGPQGEFPMEGHRVGAQLVHHVDHVLPLRVVAGVGPVPGITTIQKQRIRPIGPDRVDHSGHAIQSADAPISFGQGGEIARAERVVGRAAVFDAVQFAEIGPGDMRHRTAIVTHSDIHRWLAEVDRLELGVNVGDVDQRDIAKGVELQKLILRQRLLGCQTGPVAKPGRAHKSGRGHRHLKEIATRDHGRTFLQFRSHIRMCE